MTSSADISLLYTPQFEQFGVKLPREGLILKSGIETDVGFGDVFIMPISPSCIVMEHRITPREDMFLSEFTPIEYACATSVNQPTLSCMPESGIAPRTVASTRGPWPENTVCTFLRNSLGEQKSPLKAGLTYHSRSVLFLPEYFMQLEREYPGNFAGLFESFDSAWNEEASTAITHAIRRISIERASAPAAQLYMRSIVETMVANLAAANTAKQKAGAGTHRETRLAEEATALIERSLGKTKAPTVDELASQLYTSRSKLCVIFKQEAGESIGAYTRRRRIECAEELLCDQRLSIAQVANRLGFSHQAAFTQAFKHATGKTPRDFRAATTEPSERPEA